MKSATVFTLEVEGDTNHLSYRTVSLNINTQTERTYTIFRLKQMRCRNFPGTSECYNWLPVSLNRVSPRQSTLRRHPVRWLHPSWSTNHTTTGLRYVEQLKPTDKFRGIGYSIRDQRWRVSGRIRHRLKRPVMYRRPLRPTPSTAI